MTDGVENKDSIFSASGEGEGQTPNTPEPQKQEVVDPLVEQLAKIVDNEGRQKYDSIEKALQSIPNAQQHISTLEEENAKLRQAAEKAKTLEEVLAKLQEKGQSVDPSSVKSLGAEDVARMVEEKLKEKETETTFKTNQAMVVNALSDAYGAEAEQYYIKKAAELEMSLEDLNALSRTRPKAALKLLEVKKKEPTPQKSSGSVVTGSFDTPNKEQPKTVMGFVDTKSVLDAWRSAAPSE